MAGSPLSAAEAAKQLNIELIKPEEDRGSMALWQTVVSYQANRRAGTHSTKTKGEVAGSGAKPWRQKGTGRARAGYKRAPHWRGGGVAHGPKPRDYSQKIPKKQKRLALQRALSARVFDGDVYVITKPSLDAPKTQALLGKLAPYDGKDTALLVLDAPDTVILTSARNHPRLEVTVASDVNAEQLLRYKTVLLTEGATEKLAQRLATAAQAA